MEFLAAVVAIVALFLALKLRKRVTALELRIAEFGGLQAAAPQSAREIPPVTEPPFAAPEPAQAAAPAPELSTGERRLEGAFDAVPGADSGATPPPSEPPPPAKSFEERFGASWVVWIGGLALALGGIFLVQYSIEAGLGGPGVRIFLGFLLAAALVAAGEWTRRNDLAEGFAGVPTAHIPSILT